MQDLLAEEGTKRQAMECIRAFIERIEMHPIEKRAQCDVDLAGGRCATPTNCPSRWSG